jgi:hypothetical protein
VSNLAFLLIAVVISVVGVSVLVLRSRPPSSPHSSIDQFHEKMRALAPDEDDAEAEAQVVRRRRSRRS